MKGYAEYLAIIFKASILLRNTNAQKNQISPEEANFWK